MTGWAGAERVVEGEETRLRIFVRDAAFAALEQLRKLMDNLGRTEVLRYFRGLLSAERRLNRPGGAAAFQIRGLDGIGKPLPQIFTGQLHTIDHDLERRSVREGCGIDVVERHRAAVHEQAAKPFAPERLDGRGDCHGAGAIRRSRQLLLWTRRQFSELLDLGNFRPGSLPDSHNRQVEPQQQPRARRKGAELASDDFRGFAHHFASAVPAERASDARIQQPHVVMDLRRRSDRRSRIADAVLLADCDGRRDAVDAVDIGLFHPLEELPGVGGQRFHIAPLALGIDGVEGQR